MIARSSHRERRRTWTIDRLTGCLLDPARLVKRSLL
jgi:hypothetical protein